MHELHPHTPRVMGVSPPRWGVYLRSIRVGWSMWPSVGTRLNRVSRDHPNLPDNRRWELSWTSKPGIARGPG